MNPNVIVERAAIVGDNFPQALWSGFEIGWHPVQAGHELKCIRNRNVLLGHELKVGEVYVITEIETNNPNSNLPFKVRVSGLLPTWVDKRAVIPYGDLARLLNFHESAYRGFMDHSPPKPVENESNDSINVGDIVFYKGSNNNYSQVKVGTPYKVSRVSETYSGATGIELDHNKSYIYPISQFEKKPPISQTIKTTENGNTNTEHSGSSNIIQ